MSQSHIEHHIAIFKSIGPLYLYVMSNPNTNGMTVGRTVNTVNPDEDSGYVYLPANVRRELGLCLDSMVEVTLSNIDHEFIESVSFENQVVANGSVTVPAHIMRQAGLDGQSIEATIAPAIEAEQEEDGDGDSDGLGDAPGAQVEDDEPDDELDEILDELEAEAEPESKSDEDESEAESDEPSSLEKLFP
jgi:bifunctional DNA-binding transcriptional regulator/antitoxin component of YhaV-PrlF toxin-antitoxin module